MSDIETSPTTHDPELIGTTLESPLLSNVPAPANSVAQSPARHATGLAGAPDEARVQNLQRHRAS